MTAPSLAEFLLARIAEDETVAKACHRQIDEHHVDRFGHSRVLVECEAKRRVVEQHSAHDPLEDIFDGCRVCLTEREGYRDEWWPDPWPCATLRIIGLPYADHPDFRDEWRV